MPHYAALLRGIGPTNPNMRNEKLRSVFEALGFSDVVTVISSGNVLFESSSRSIPSLEARIEKALPEQLGFTSTVIIRSKEDLQRIISEDPFKKVKDDSKAYLIVTFLKKKPGEIYNVVDFRKERTPDFMRQLEKKTWQRNNDQDMENGRQDSQKDGE